MIEEIKNFVHDYPPVTSVLLTSFVTLLIYVFRPKVKLIWGSKSDFKHIMRPKADGQQQIVVHTAHYFLQNVGRLPAKQVELVLNFSCDEISIWPQRQYSVSKNNEGRQIVAIDFIASKEAVDVFLLNIGNDLPALMNVKCPDAEGKPVPISYNRSMPKIVYFCCWSLIFLGVVFIIEKIIDLILGLHL